MVKEALAPLVDLIYPPRCPLCGEGVDAPARLCANCWDELAIVSEPACRFCQRAFDGDAVDGLPRDAGPDATPNTCQSREEWICPKCLADPPLHEGATAGVFYNSAARRLVLAFKTGRKIALAPMLARLIVNRLPTLEGEWIAVPVPLHRWRLWERGFNQSALLAAEVARVRGFELMVDALVRPKQTRKLGELGRAERAQMLAGAIRVNKRHAERLRGAQVLLVDDVLTSGATTGACIAALRQAGVAKVRIACFARVSEDMRQPGHAEEKQR